MNYDRIEVNRYQSLKLKLRGIFYLVLKILRRYSHFPIQIWIKIESWASKSELNYGKYLRCFVTKTLGKLFKFYRVSWFLCRIEKDHGALFRSIIYKAEALDKRSSSVWSVTHFRTGFLSSMLMHGRDCPTCCISPLRKCNWIAWRSTSIFGLFATGEVVERVFRWENGKDEEIALGKKNTKIFEEVWEIDAIWGGNL